MDSSSKLRHFYGFANFSLALGALIIQFIPMCIFVLIYLVCELLKFIFRIYLGKQLGYEIEYLTGLDTIVTRKPHLPQLICQGFYIVKGKIDVKMAAKRAEDQLFKIENGIKQCQCLRLTIYPDKFCGFYYWKCEKNFCSMDHVKEYSCTPPKNETELYQLFGEVCSKPLPTGEISPWILLLIPLADDFEGFDRSPRTVLFLRFNHCLGDGVSIIRMLTKLYLDDEIDQLVSVPLPVLSGSRFWSIARVLFYSPIGIFKQMLLMYDKSSLIGPSLTGVKLISFSKPICLKRVKRIKNSAGNKTTINDVFMSCVAAAFRWYFLQEGVRLPKVHVTIPISFHNLAEPAGNLKNYSSFVAYSIPIDLDDPIKRLVATKNRMRELKNDPSVMRNLVGLNQTFNHLPEVLTDFLIEWNQVTAIVSNIPGPQQQSTAVGGHIVERFGGIIPHSHKTGIGISLISFNGTLQFGIHADVAVIPKQELVNQFINECTKEMFALENLLVHDTDA